MNRYLWAAALLIRRKFSKNHYPVGISVDVTNRCNLRCKHCYFFKQDFTSELSKDQFISRLKELRSNHPSLVQASWIGGEPLLRQDIVEEGMKLFPFNMVVTNGTIELPRWKNCVFNISVDGTKEYYEQIRGPHYEQVKAHADRNDIRINIACVLNMKNYECIEEMLLEWSKTKVNGVIFSFYTPIEGNADDLWIDWALRDEIIGKLLLLKKKYGNFLMISESVLNLMKSENAKKIVAHCPTKIAALSIDPLGKIKRPCVLGEKADCTRCGCIIPYQLESVINKKQWESLYITGKGLVG